MPEGGHTSLLAYGYDATSGIAMPAKVLGGTMSHEISSEEQWALQYRGGNRVVDNQFGVMTMAQLCDGCHINHPKDGIGELLSVHDTRSILGETLRALAEIGHIAGDDGNAVRRKKITSEHGRSTVHVARSKNMCRWRW